MKRRRCIRAGLLVVVLGGMPVQSRAQELEPRAYSPSPVGANFLVAGYVHSSGDVVLDPSLPLSNVDAQLNAGTVGYGRTFGVLGRSANILMAAPYVWGDISGDVYVEARSLRPSSRYANLRRRSARA
jgi:hypothetical protein